MKRLVFLSVLIITISGSSLALAQVPTSTPTLQVIYPGLSVVKTASVTFFQNGDSFFFTIFVNNYSTSIQNNLSLVDTLPGGINLTSWNSTISGLIGPPAGTTVTGPAAVTFGPFSMAVSTTAEINLTITADLNSTTGVLQNKTNTAMLYQNDAPVGTGNASGLGCAGATLAFAATPSTTGPSGGTAQYFSNGANQGYVVGNNGYAGYWNGSTMTALSSGTTNDLLGDDGCSSGTSILYDVAVGRDRTVLVNNGSGFVSLSGIPYFESDNDFDDRRTSGTSH
jgi:uncharacterized repeat protein (TIGR01451 family)